MPAPSPSSALPRRRAPGRGAGVMRSFPNPSEHAARTYVCSALAQAGRAQPAAQDDCRPFPWEEERGGAGDDDGEEEEGGVEAEEEE